MEAFETLIERIAPNLYAYRDRFFTSFAATFEMFGKAGLIAFVVGLFFGVLLVITRKGGVRQNLVVYQIVNIVINVFRSIPFIILLIFLIPLTRAVVGSAIGVKGAILPLVFGTVPFYTRQVEVALTGVNEGKVEAARSMGSGTLGLIFRVYLHEAVPELIRVTTVTAISLIGLTTMAGAVGAGGIGSFAINYGQGGYRDLVNAWCIAAADRRVHFANLTLFTGATHDEISSFGKVHSRSHCAPAPDTPQSVCQDVYSFWVQVCLLLKKLWGQGERRNQIP